MTNAHGRMTKPVSSLLHHQVIRHWDLIRHSDFVLRHSHADGGTTRLFDYWPHVGWFALVDALLIVLFIPWVLLTKKDTTAAMAWCLIVLFMPLLGAFLFWVFGYAHVHRPLRRKRLHRAVYDQRHP